MIVLNEREVILQADLRVTGEQLDQVLDILPAALLSFEVGAPLNRPADALFVPVRLTILHRAAAARVYGGARAE